jgi:hypothetical protein
MFDIKELHNDYDYRQYTVDKSVWYSNIYILLCYLFCLRLFSFSLFCLPFFCFSQILELWTAKLWLLFFYWLFIPKVIPEFWFAEEGTDYFFMLIFLGTLELFACWLMWTLVIGFLRAPLRLPSFTRDLPFF